MMGRRSVFSYRAMQLFISGQSLHTLDVSKQDTVLDVKTRVAQLEGLEDCDLVLSYGGAALGDDVLLSQSGVGDQCTLDLSGRLLGGKVHGSLARAGKVRGQTPKVAKQEKKKKKTGRAKRRMQYNRRFVNVVPTFGKKKGPNSNS
ncbi:ubiquitin-like FUBI-ribosomal protein eS30 fusion protein isoform X2 [Aquarana catesbeiana]|uniref:ubiquitin-like FUBI-ribosomal protein eS30 fusion protein isoform X2 n=1 Tax=Aquarana catesbeiana TaxID=8400 RepID=UPI003CC966E9